MTIGIGGSDWLGFGTGGAAREESMSHDLCGRKPGILASKSRKDSWEECVRSVAEGKINVALAQAQAAKSTNGSSKNNQKIIIGGLIAALIVVVFLVVKNRK